jgi:hypothetical protein
MGSTGYSVEYKRDQFEGLIKIYNCIPHPIFLEDGKKHMQQKEETEC